MNYIFAKNMFSEYSKETLEELFDEIRKYEEEGLTPNCLVVEEAKIKSHFKWLQHSDTFELAEKEFFDEIAKRYFSELYAELIKEKLEHYKNLKTYTDCEEYRREGAIGVLEDIIEAVGRE